MNRNVRKNTFLPRSPIRVRCPHEYTLYPWLRIQYVLSQYCDHSALGAHITKTCLYHFDPLKPHFYIVKLGFTGVYIIFLISAQNIDCGYTLEPPLTSTHNLCFEQKYEKYQSRLSGYFSVFGGEIFYPFE